jgi:hypothetical protein
MIKKINNQRNRDQIWKAKKIKWGLNGKKFSILYIILNLKNKNKNQKEKNIRVALKMCKGRL